MPKLGSIVRTVLAGMVGLSMAASACSGESGGGSGGSGGRGDAGQGVAGDPEAVLAGGAGQPSDGSADSEAVGGRDAAAGAPGEGGAAGGEGGAVLTAAVSGIVTAFRPNPASLEERVSGALITLDDGNQQFSVESDGDGLFSFETVPPGRYLASVTVSAAARRSHDGAPYGDWYGEVDVVAKQSTRLMPMLNLGCAISTTVEAAQETLFDSNGFGSMGCGAYDLFGRLRIPSGGLARANGDAFAGKARLELSPIWYPVIGGQPNMKGLGAMPPLIGVPQGEMEPEPMHTFAAADIRVYDEASGEKLVLKEGTLAQLTLRGWRALTEDDAYTSWSFDPATGTWREEGDCVADTSDPQLVHCDVRHFSWWNADGRSSDGGSGSGVVVTFGCVVGGVLYKGMPVIGADVISSGADGIAGLAKAQTDDVGAFCAAGPTSGGDWDVQVRVANGREILLGSLFVARGKVPATCEDPLRCAQAGVIELKSSLAVTVRGKLGLTVNGERQPMPQGGFSFGRRVRVIGSTDDYGIVQLNLGVVPLASDGSYEFEIPEVIVRLFFVSPQDGECRTYPSRVPGEGDPVMIDDQFFICGS